MYIAHSHVFLPIITASSSRRGWVHQEIGYAMAKNIPVLPVTVGEKAIPGEMIQQLQSIRLDEDSKRWESQLREQLTSSAFGHLTSDFSDDKSTSPAKRKRKPS